MWRWWTSCLSKWWQRFICIIAQTSPSILAQALWQCCMEVVRPQKLDGPGTLELSSCIYSPKLKRDRAISIILTAENCNLFKSRILGLQRETLVARFLQWLTFSMVSPFFIPGLIDFMMKYWCNLYGTPARVPRFLHWQIAILPYYCPGSYSLY